MIWAQEIYAGLYAAFGFLAHNHAQCSSTHLLQIVLFGVAGASLARIGLRAAAGGRLRRRLVAVDLDREPALRAALAQASRIVPTKRTIECHWAKEHGFQLATLGYFRPSLVIGRQVVEGLAPEELEAALAHELMHAARRDVLRGDLGRAGLLVGGLASLFALILFLAFFVGVFAMDRGLALAAIAGGLVLLSAGARALGRRLDRKAEFACDRAAASGRGGPLAVAAAIVKVAKIERARRRPLPAIAPLFSAETFHLRVRRLIAAADLPAAPSRGAKIPPTRTAWMLAALPILVLIGSFDIEEAAAEGCATCQLVVEKTALWAR